MNPTFYINWALYAIVGGLREADEIMRSHRHSILQVASALRADYGVPEKTLYRGVLAPKGIVKGGVLKPEPRVTFVSFSEDRDVACWFSDKRAFISAYILEHDPTAVGWIATYAPDPDEVLFSHRWHDICSDLVRAARMHPYIDEQQLEWNVKTQSEVITLPVEVPLPVVRHADSGCASTADLDRRLMPPWLS